MGVTVSGTHLGKTIKGYGKVKKKKKAIAAKHGQVYSLSDAAKSCKGYHFYEIRFIVDVRLQM